MPRGNDAENAAAEAAQRYGMPTNAAELIDAQRASRDARVDRAAYTAVDEGATQALDLDDLPVNPGETVVAAAVRGNYVIAVIHDEYGNVLPKRLMDVPKAARAESTSEQIAPGGGVKVRQPDVEPAGDQAAKDAAARATARKAAEEAQAKADEAQAEADRKAGEAERRRMEAEDEARAKAQDEQKSADAAAAAAQAEKDAEANASDAAKASGAPGPATDDGKAAAAKAAASKPSGTKAK